MLQLKAKAKDIKTKRLLLQKWKVEDAQALFDYASHEDVGPHAGWKPHSSVSESKEIIKKIFQPNICWKIKWLETGEIIGSIGLEPDKRREDVNSKEMGYSLAHDFWGKGIMTEAAVAVRDYAFEEFGLEVLAIQTGPTNDRSQRIIKKLGFTYEGTLRKAYKIYDGSVRDVLAYSLLRSEWEQIK
ncbi:MAG: GNAT family protein [Anaerovoracaceae bacterium]